MSRAGLYLTGLGSILFLVAAFLPYSRVFIEQSAEKKIEIIMNMRGMWNFGHVLFGFGSLITVAGLGLLVSGNREAGSLILSYLAVILLGTGALLWSWHVTERMLDPQGFADGTNTPYLFLIYSVLTQIGLFLIGFYLLKAHIKDWVAWMFIIGSAVLFILMIIFRDMPPFVYYVLTLVMSVAFLV
jgi:hypothetical protein